MNPDLSKVLSELAHKLGTSVEHLWPLLVRHAFVSNLVGLVLGVLILTASAITSGLGLRRLVNAPEGKKSYMQRSYKEDCVVSNAKLWAFLPIIGVVIGLIIIAVTIPDVVVPESTALRNILNR